LLKRWSILFFHIEQHTNHMDYIYSIVANEWTEPKFLHQHCQRLQPKTTTTSDDLGIEIKSRRMLLNSLASVPLVESRIKGYR
jgi:hypothetical protein